MWLRRASKRAATDRRVFNTMESLVSAASKFEVNSNHKNNGTALLLSNVHLLKQTPFWEKATSPTVLALLPLMHDSGIRDQEVLSAFDAWMVAQQGALSFTEVGAVITWAVKLGMPHAMSTLRDDILRVMPFLAAGDAVNMLWALVSSSDSPDEGLRMALLSHIAASSDELDPVALARCIWCCTKVTPSCAMRKRVLDGACMRLSSLVEYAVPTQTLCSILQALSHLVPSFRHNTICADICHALAGDLVQDVHPAEAAKTLAALHRLGSIGTGDSAVPGAVRALSAVLGGVAAHDLKNHHIMMSLTAVSQHEADFDVVALRRLAQELEARILTLRPREVVQALYTVSVVSATSSLRSRTLVDGLLARTWVCLPEMETLSIAILSKALYGLCEEYYVAAVLQQLHVAIQKRVGEFRSRELVMVLHSLHSIRPHHATPVAVTSAVADSIHSRLRTFGPANSVIIVTAYSILMRGEDVVSLPAAVALFNAFGDYLIESDGSGGLSPHDAVSTLQSFARSGVHHPPLCRALEPRLTKLCESNVSDGLSILSAFGRLGFRSESVVKAVLSRQTDLITKLSDKQLATLTYGLARQQTAPPGTVLRRLENRMGSMDEQTRRNVLRSLSSLKHCDNDVVDLVGRYNAVDGQ
eukprot:PhM_4_TR6100/c0_g1_i1/m.8382